MTHEIVEWRKVPGLENYSVSSEGQVRRDVRIRYAPPGLLRQHSQRRYPYVALTLASGVYTKKAVHQLVALAFIGPVPDGQVVRHLDGDSANPHWKNLAYGTHLENSQDAIRHGTQVRGARQHLAIATDEMARAIKTAYVSGAKQRDLAREHCVSVSLVNSMVTGETWTHVEPRGDLRLMRAAPRQYGFGGGVKTSKHEGVCWDTRRGRWRAYCVVNRRQISFGSHKTEDEAREAVVAGRLSMVLKDDGEPLTRATPSGRQARVWRAVR